MIQDSISNRVEADKMDYQFWVKTFWKGRKTIITFSMIFLLLGTVLVISSPKEYMARSVMVPQTQTKNARWARIGRLTGPVKLKLPGRGNSSSDLSPLIYPRLVKSTPFIKELITIPLHWSSVNEEMSLLEYRKNNKPKRTAIGIVRKYTIGLPFVIMRLFRGEQKDKELDKPLPVSTSPGILSISRDERKAMALLKKGLQLVVNRQEGYIELTCTMQDPLIAAQVAKKAQGLLQKYITEFKIEKVNNNLVFIQARYDETKLKYEEAQKALASYKDRHQNLSTAMAITELEKLSSAYQLAEGVYNALANKLNEAKTEVSENTPVFTIIQPVSIPSNPIGTSAVLIVLIVGIIGALIGFGIIGIKTIIPEIKNQWESIES